MYKKNYLHSCRESTGGDIYSLLESAKKISFSTFRRHVNGLEEFAKNMGYESASDGRKKSKGLVLKDDPFVGYFKGVYRGKECYFLKHSAIEYIWT